MLTSIEKFARTVSYVTCFPLWKHRHEDDETSLSGLSKYLPLAGLVVGAALAVVALLLRSLSAPDLVTAALLTIFWFLFTQGLHLDGLMDTADGIFSHQDRERMLAIMQDSRVGNFGVLVGLCALLAKFAALACLGLSNQIMVLLVVPAWARFCEVYAIGHFPYLRETGKGKIWHETISYPRDLYDAALLPGMVSLVLAALGQWTILAVIVAAIVAGVTAAQWLAAKLGGQTGDTYGAVVEIAEAAALVAAALIVR